MRKLSIKLRELQMDMLISIMDDILDNNCACKELEDIIAINYAGIFKPKFEKARLDMKLRKKKDATVSLSFDEAVHIETAISPYMSDLTILPQLAPILDIRYNYIDTLMTEQQLNYDKKYTSLNYNPRRILNESKT